MRSYDELFEERGGAYDRAMRRFPEARRAEFTQVLERLAPMSGMAVADGIERILGVDPLPGGGIGMRWGLMTIMASNEHFV